MAAPKRHRNEMQGQMYVMMIERDRYRDTPRHCQGVKARLSDWDPACGLHQMGWLPPSLDGIAMCQNGGVTATETKGRQP